MTPQQRFKTSKCRGGAAGVAIWRFKDPCPSPRRCPGDEAHRETAAWDEDVRLKLSFVSLARSRSFKPGVASLKCYVVCPHLPVVNKFRPALSGGMDWWRREWPFSRVRKIFFRGRNLQENPSNSAERTIFAKFQAPKLEISEPEKLQFHTPSHSIPPLDPLLKFMCL